MQNIDKDIFRFVYAEAMKDATMRKAYTGEKKWLTEKSAFESVKEVLSDLINGVINNKYTSPDQYNKDFLETASKVCRVIDSQKHSDNKSFTFGNAQKLINMMFKYFYIICYKNDSMRERFRFCHCPMDSKMLKSVWDKKEILSSRIDLGKSNFYTDCWSGIDFDDNNNPPFPERYLKFQKAVRYLADDQNITAIEYDYKVWTDNQNT